MKLRDSGLSIVLVEQNSRVALGFSERTVVMDKGRIVYDGAVGGAARRSGEARAGWSASWRRCRRAEPVTDSQE